MVYFTLAAAVLYLFSNWLVDRIEVAAGRRFQYRVRLQTNGTGVAIF